jgi:hypothetical protein
VIPLQPVAPDPDFRAGQKRMHFVKDKIERDGLNLVVRRAKPDIVEGAAAARFVLKGELVIGNRPRDAAGKGIKIRVLEGVENLGARRHAQNLLQEMVFCKYLLTCLNLQ